VAPDPPSLELTSERDLRRLQVTYTVLAGLAMLPVALVFLLGSQSVLVWTAAFVFSVPFVAVPLGGARTLRRLAAGLDGVRVDGRTIPWSGVEHVDLDRTRPYFEVRVVARGRTVRTPCPLPLEAVQVRLGAWWEAADGPVEAEPHVAGADGTWTGVRLRRAAVTKG